jgi:hypothetical protein
MWPTKNSNKQYFFAVQVMESYTVGRENFGMDKEFIVDVVQNCPNPACRFYKMDNLSRKQMEQIKSTQQPMEQYTQKMQMEMSKQQHFQAVNHEYPPEIPFNPPPSVDANQNNNNQPQQQQQQQQQSYNNQMTEQADRLADLLRANLDSIEGLSEAKVKLYVKTKVEI